MSVRHNVMRILKNTVEPLAFALYVLVKWYNEKTLI